MPDIDKSTRTLRQQIRQPPAVGVLTAEQPNRVVGLGQDRSAMHRLGEMARQGGLIRGSAKHRPKRGVRPLARDARIQDQYRWAVLPGSPYRRRAGGMRDV